MLVTRRHHPVPSHGRAGYSLIQLLVVITLLGTLVTMAIPGYRIFIERARNAAATGQLAEIDIAINEHQLANAAMLPANLSEIGFDPALDPWGSTIVYVNFSLGGAPRLNQFGDPVNSDYDLYSAGPDRATALSLTASESQDDIVLAGDGGFVGTVAKYRSLD